MPIEIGRRFGRYEVQSRLGAGGMGEVYLARDTHLGRPVALKLLPGDIEDKGGLKRFEQEAFAASALNHPNILTVYEIASDEGRHCIATEFVDGETLRQRMAAGRPPVSEAIEIAEQVARALAAAHAAGIVHRDIKPENIMLRRDGFVKVVDFGLAKLTEHGEASGSDMKTTSVFMTQPGLILGTVAYMSPEQLRGQPLDGRSDLWSLGVTLYEMLAGRHPFNRSTVSDTIAATLEREPPAPGPREHVLPEADRIVRKALAKDRDARYQSAKDLAIDLKQLQRQLTIDAEAARSPQTPQVEQRPSGSDRQAVRWRPALLWIGLALAAAVALLSSLPRVLKGPASSPVVEGIPEPARPPVVERSLEYGLVVEPLRQGQPFKAAFEASPDQVLGNGWRFQLKLRSPQAGSFYLLSDESPTDGIAVFRMLFPSPSVNEGVAAYTAGQPIETGWYRLDERPATETLWIVWSAGPVSELEVVKGVVNPEELGAIKDPARARAIRQFLAEGFSPQPAEPLEAGSPRRVVRAPGDVLVTRVDLRHQ